MNGKVYVFDLDGTLADISHRVHYIDRKKKDWNSFNKSCVDDSIIEETVEILRSLYKCSYKIIILTGRSDSVKQETVLWLKRNKIPYDELCMRPNNSREEDWKYKNSWLLENIGMNVVGVFEDRLRVVDMWRKNGIRCFHVGGGDF